MVLSPGQRRFALTLHILVSVGFPGAVGSFFALALAGLGGNLGVYSPMEAITIAVIVPLCLLTLISGVISSLGTPWGLFRYWWVLVKIVLTVPSTLILLVHLALIARMATATSLDASTTETQLQLVIASGAALAVLVLLTALSVYKPRGLTPFAG